MTTSATRLDRWATRMLAVGVVGFLVTFAGALVLIAMQDAGTGDLDYDFEVVREEALVTVRRDGSVDIDYTIVMVNHGDLDGVDVGLPNRHYDDTSAWAYVEVDGERFPPREIRRSPYVETGLAVEFTDECRRAAEMGTPEVTVRFHVGNPHMVYTNELRDGTAGVRFRPTWFGGDFQRGPTGNLVVRIMGPEGHVDTNATYYIKGMEPDSVYVTTEGRLLASWEFPAVRPGDQAAGDYDVGMAFPGSYVAVSYEHSFSERAGDFLSSLGHTFYVIWPFLGVSFFLTLIVVALVIHDRSRRRSYFDPQLTVPGAGPRKDLLAVEAAVVLEVPLERVAAMVLFGMQRKGIVKVDYEADPMVIEKLDEVGEHLFETRFLSSIKVGGRVSRKFLRGAMVKLVEDVQEKMEGFGLEATREHYRGVCASAWSEMEAAGALASFEGLLDEKEEWLLLDDGYEDRMDDLAIHVVPSSGTAGGSGVDVRAIARSRVSRLRSACSRLVDGIGSLSRDVTQVTHPPPEGGGGGGMGGGCACACACACAGGGR